MQRSLRSLNILDARDERVTFHLVTTDDKVSNFQHVEGAVLEAVPQHFLSRKARFKARSLEWFRLSRVLRDTDWILHLDEETIIDQCALSACLTFIEWSQFQIGQVSSYGCASTQLSLEIVGCHLLQFVQLLAELASDSRRRWETSRRPRQVPPTVPLPAYSFARTSRLIHPAQWSSGECHNLGHGMSGRGLLVWP